MTREEIKQKTSLCFLLNPNVSEEEKNYVIERVMATKATTVSKAALCNIITYIMKQNTKLQEKLNIRSCQNCKHNNKSCPSDGSCVHYNKWEEYKNPQLTKAKEIIKEMLSILPKENIEGIYEITEKAEQFLRELEE